MPTRGHLSWHRTTVDGRQAWYGAAGEGPPLVFLHGWGLGYRSYKQALKHLVLQGHRVIAPALPGFGDTAPLPEPECSLAGYARWLDRFLTAVGVEEPVQLVGHSFGGGVAIQAAHDLPDRVACLVLVNSIGGSAWGHHGSAVRSMVERPIWDWGLHLPRDLLPARQLRRVLPVILEDAVPNLVRRPRVLWRVSKVVRAADLTHELDDLRERALPIAILWGEADRVLTWASFESLRDAAGVDDEACVVVPGSHGWLLADPAAFGEVMTNVRGILSAQVRQRAATRRHHIGRRSA
jgi:pimeloyl-ACP methyl ester carboxylesterase